ncbi:MAG: CPBP family intramembrane glutamic endopeptidase [Pikeienuella sp.]
MIPSKARLWAEFITLFAGAPLLLTATFGMYPLLPVVCLFGLGAAGLLHITPGWSWSMLRRGPVWGEWRLLLAYSFLMVAVSLGFVFALVPDHFLSIPIHRPTLWITILVFYPLVSAFPQEIIYRSLFFERYGVLFPNNTVAILANGLVFGFGHLFFDHWLTIGMTGIGGAIFGWAYLRNRSVGLPWVMHGLAGQIIFTVGLGVFFYHGAVGATP